MREMSQLAADAGVKLRPHVKVHETAMLSKMQIEDGACGIEVGNVAQAKRMAEEGINDILIAHPFYGSQKLEALQKLTSKPGLKLSVVVDMIEQAEVISQVGQAVGNKVRVILKIDTGIKRYGVLPGIELVGIYAHESGAVPTDEGVARVALEVGSIMAEMARMLRGAGITLETVCVGR